MIQKMIAIDWRTMKFYQLRLFILPPAALIFGVVYAPIYVIPMLVFLALSFSVNPFAMEEKGELNNLYLTLPVTRKQVVTGRYSLSLLMFVASILLGIPLMLLSNTISFSKYYIGVEGMIALIAASTFIYAIINLFMFPMLFKLGYQKGKMWGFYLPAIFFAIAFGVYYVLTMNSGYTTLSIDLINYAANHLVMVSGGFLLISVLLLFVSYMLSVRFYSKRNL